MSQVLAGVVPGTGAAANEEKSLPSLLEETDINKMLYKPGGEQ